MTLITTTKSPKKIRSIPLLVEGAIAMMCVLCLLIGLTYANYRQLEEANRLNLHTYHVLEKIVVLRGAMNEGELRLRGFALTDDARSLARLKRAEEHVGVALGDLENLTADNQAQQQRLRDFAGKYEDWKQRYARIRGTSLAEAKRVGVETERRRAELDQLDARIDVIENAERQLLQARASEQVSSQRRAARFLLIASICALTFTGAVVVLLGLQVGAAHETNRRLIASQAQLEAVLETAPIVLYSVDLEEKFTLMTGRGAGVLGLSPEATIGQKIGDVLGASYNLEPVRAALQGASNVSRSSVRNFTFETNRLPMRDEQGIITGMIGVGLDVTERVQAEEALRQSEARFRSVIESLQEVVFQIDAQGQWSFLNPAWRLLLGHDIESSLGKWALDYAPPEDRDSIAKFLDAPTGERKQVRRELVRIRSRSGNYRWMDANIQLEWDQDGVFMGASGTLSDINDRKLAQEELLATTTLQKAILNSSNYLIIAVKADGTIESFNRAAQELLGYSTEEVRGLQTPLIFHDEAELEARAEELSDELGRPITGGLEVLTCKTRGGAIEEREWTYVNRSGRRVPMRLSISELRGLEGELRGFLIVGYDLTDTQRAESLKNEFVSVVSHELRTPVTSIRGALGLLAGGVAGQLPDSARQMIEIARKNSDRLVLLINDILDIEKIESGKMRFETKTLVVRDLLQSSIEQNAGYGETLGVNLVINDPEKLEGLEIQGDEDRLHQVLSNLISNGCKFTPAGGTVHIGAEVRGNAVHVSVLDEGPGVPPEFIPRLFEKFAQADSSSTRKQGGTGLGLAIAKAIVEKHGGKMQYVAPEEGQGGACFSFDLPLVAAAIQKTAPLTKRVLICEDEAEAAELLSLFISKSGYEADIASTIDEARAKLQEGGYVGMTLDLLLPDGDGLDFLAELRANPATHDFPIIVVSINSKEGALLGEAFNVLDWLRKPIDAQRLLAALEQFHSTQSPRILHVEDDEDVRHIMAAILGESAQITPAATLQEAHSRLEKSQARGERFDLAILDVGLPDGSGLELVSLLSAANPPVPVILFSASELSSEEAHLVTASLVKSRTNNDVLRETIERLLNPPPA